MFNIYENDYPGDEVADGVLRLVWRLALILAGVSLCFM